MTVCEKLQANVTMVCGEENEAFARKIAAGSGCVDHLLRVNAKTLDAMAYSKLLLSQAGHMPQPRWN